MNLFSVDPTTLITNTLSFISSIVTVAQAIQSQKDNVSKNEKAEHLIAKSLREIQHSTDQIIYSLEDHIELMETLEQDYNTKHMEDKFKSGIFVLFDNAQIKKYADIKQDLDLNVCQAINQTNLILKLAISSNPRNGQILIELLDEAQNVLNNALLERATFREVQKETLEFLRTISQRIRQIRSNRT